MPLQVPVTLGVQREWEERALCVMGLSPVARISRKSDIQPESGVNWLQRARVSVTLCSGSPGYTENTLLCVTLNNQQFRITSSNEPELLLA